MPLTSGEFSLMANQHWKSPESNGEYPISWQIQIPKPDCLLEVQSVFENQEMRTGNTTGITYWEGAIEASGKLQNSEVYGVGYLELTGYVGQGLGSLLD